MNFADMLHEWTGSYKLHEHKKIIEYKINKQFEKKSAF